MNVLRAQVNIPMDNGVPEDAVVNTWHFRSDLVSGFEADAAEVHAHLTGFYQAIDGLVFANSVATPATVKYYLLGDLEPRVPIVESTIALTPTASDPLPAEVAICASFSADVVSGGVRARRRGRVFLGPVGVGSVDQVAPFARPGGTVITGINTAAFNLQAAAESGGTPWVVFSPTTRESAPLADSIFPVTNGWCDNAFDTIRSRGPVATTRAAWAAV